MIIYIALPNVLGKFITEAKRLGIIDAVGTTFINGEINFSRNSHQ
jgi:hypothetical protein